MAVATRTNEEIKKDVVEHQYWDMRVDASDVNVEVKNGTVHLSGTVPNYTAYQAAEEDAWSIAGVAFVNNDLSIKYPSGIKIPSDGEIANNIENMLLWQQNIDASSIEVAVLDGIVTLRGTVDAFWKKIKAEEVALGVIGVTDVVNDIAIVPTERIVDKTIAENIEAAMERNVKIDVDTLTIEVENGRVTLTGTVSSLSAFRAAQKIAENTLGVLFVDNKGLAIK